MIKNPSPRRIAIYTSAVASTITLGAFFILNAMLQWQSFWGLSITVISVFLTTYFLFYYSLEVFIYRKIKLIYKTIYSLKSGKSKKIDLDTDIFNDVNKRVLDWAANQQSEIEQLKRLETFRREFLGNVSHELKTPLFTIQGYIHTLIDTDLEDAHIHRLYLDKAARNIERLCTIVDDLEAISKLESGELVLELRSFDIHELVKDVFDSLEFKAKEKNIALEFKEGCDKTFLVEADKERTRQVLVNLIVNSIKYGKHAGKTQIGLYDMHENILIEVSDNGIGLEQKDLSRVFERFYRVDKSRSREQGGTGLGLAIVKHIIEAHQQTINVRSSYGIGSTFGFTLKKG